MRPSRYMDLIKGRRPVMGEMKAEEVERLRKTAVADLSKVGAKPRQRFGTLHTTFCTYDRLSS